MFQAKLPGKCPLCRKAIVPGQMIATGAIDGWNGKRTYIHTDCAVPGTESYEADRDRKEDEADRAYEAWCAEQYRHPGLVFSPIDGGWVHPDIRDGNAFGRYEREQENAAYDRELAWEQQQYRIGLAEGQRFSAERKIYGDALAEQFAMQDEMNAYNRGDDY